MSAFQCNITPTRNRVEKKRNEDREPTIVDLKPFSAKAIVTFDGVPVGKEARRLVIVSNPFDEEIKVSLIKVPKPEFNLTIEWSVNRIPAQSQKNLQLIWSPTKVVSCREVIQLCDDSGNKKDLAVILKSCELKKTTTTRKVAPHKYTKTLTLKPPSPPSNFTLQPTRKISKTVPSQVPSIAQSPLRNATNFHQHDLIQRNIISPAIVTDKENASPKTPQNATGLFDNIRFTPQTETKDKCESKLEFLASLPTPVPSKREDIILSESAPRRRIITDSSSPVVQRLNSPRSPLKELSEVLEIDEIEIVLNDPGTSVFSKTRVVSVTTPLGAISEEEPLVSTQTYFHKTFDVNKSASFFDISEEKVRASESMRETCLPVPDINVQQLRSNQGSMPNLNEINAVSTFEHNRYFLQPPRNEDRPNISIESLASNADFHETEICAQSSRLALNEIVSPGVPSRADRTKLIRPAPSERSPSFLASPTVRRVKLEPDFKSPPKKPAAVAMTFSPPSNCKFTSELREIRNRETFEENSKGRRIRATTWKQQQNLFAVPRVPRDLQLKPTNLTSQSLQSLSSSATSVASTSSVPASLTSGRLYNENYANVYNRNDPFSATTTIDPFLTSTMYLDEQTLDGIEKSYKKWLNALVTIPPDLETDRDEKIDVGKLFQDVQNKELTLAPTKEVVCSRYYTSRLDLLRSTAVQFFHSAAISTPLNKITVVINDKNKLEVNAERKIHLDLVLQRSLLELLLCYNPLWLRIGLEVVMNVQLNLTSNQDIYGMSRFIINNLFKCQYLQEKYSKFSQQREYLDKLRKFTAKNFLFIIFFLDRAKEHRLIKQNPCLFVKKAPYKESAEILKKFASLVLANYGDIVRTLRRFDYTLTHKQTVIDEFNFAFQKLGVDLRDGVRLTKVMEIILMRDDLVQKVRVPAISRLQKIHNVELALKALEAADYQILGDITSRDIADGHREKTLSLLWQIIYKFRAPRFNAAAATIQKFWRSKYLLVVINRRIKEKEEQKRHQAATVIQKHFRAWKTRKEVRQYRTKITSACVVIQKNIRVFIARRRYQKQVQAVTCIQRWYRRQIEVKVSQRHFRLLRSSAIVIQSWWRRRVFKIKLKAACVVMMQRREAAVKIQQKFRATLMMRQDRDRFFCQRVSAVVIQSCWRRHVFTRKLNAAFAVMKQRKQAAITIQQKYRATLAMRQERRHFQLQRTSAIIIQSCWRRYIFTRELDAAFVIMKQRREAAVRIQRKFRATLMMKQERKHFLLQRSSAAVIQSWWRRQMFKRRLKAACAVMKQQKEAAVKIQQKYRATLAMRLERNHFQQQRASAVVIQSLWRRYVFKRNLQAAFTLMHQRREAVTKIQRKLRATIAMRQERTHYQLQKTSATVIQSSWRHHVFRSKLKRAFAVMKQRREAAVKIQRKYRATLAMRQERAYFKQQRDSAIVVQSWWRRQTFKNNLNAAFAVMKQRREAAVKIQRKYRATLVMRQEQKQFQLQRASAVMIQSCWRRYVLKRNLKSAFAVMKQRREAAICIQQKYRATLAMRHERRHFQLQQSSALVVQSWWRRQTFKNNLNAAFVFMKQRRESAVKIQQKFRATLMMRQEKKHFQLQRQAAICIQQKYRATLAMRLERRHFQLKQSSALVVQSWWRRQIFKSKLNAAIVLMKQRRESAVTIQRKFRATLMMRQEQKHFQLQRSSAIAIQSCWRRYIFKKNLEAAFAVMKQRRDAAVKIQQKFRATLVAKKERAHFLQLKTLTIKLQQRFRSKVLMLQLTMRFYYIQYYTVAVQQRFRANQNMKKQRNEFIKMKAAAVVIQRRFRATLLMRQEREKFQKMKSAAVVIQHRLRSTIKMESHRSSYQELRQTVIKVQQRFRANKLMVVERQNFLQLRGAAVFVQRRFLLKLKAKKLRRDFAVTRKVVVRIQTRVRGYLARKRFAEMKTPERLELRRQHKAARAIQAAYRGYRERSKASNRCFKVIVQRLVKASKNVNPAQTLASKLKTSIDFLKDSYDANLAITFLAKLEYISRIVPWMLIDDAEFVAIFCCGIMGQAIRSEIDKQIIELCSCIILNLSRYKDTKEVAFQEYGLVTISQMLLRWCDKDCGIFNTLCTLIWVFAHCDTKKKAIRNFMLRDGEFIISQIRHNVARKENMRKNSRRPIGFQSISLIKYKKDYLQQLRFNPQATVYSSGFITPEMLQQCHEVPSLQPDYGVVKTKPYIFYSSVFAFDNLLNKLEIKS